VKKESTLNSKQLQTGKTSNIEFNNQLTVESQYDKLYKKTINGAQNQIKIGAFQLFNNSNI
jgi:hypothetical protein